VTGIRVSGTSRHIPVPVDLDKTGICDAEKPECPVLPADPELAGPARRVRDESEPANGFSELISYLRHRAVKATAWSDPDKHGLHRFADHKVADTCPPGRAAGNQPAGPGNGKGSIDGFLRDRTPGHDPASAVFGARPARSVPQQMGFILFSPIGLREDSLPEYAGGFPAGPRGTGDR
jgi:hypothetical protein